MSLTIIGTEPRLFIHDDEGRMPDCGPYKDAADASTDLKGLEKFYKYHNKPMPVRAEDTGLNGAATPEHIDLGESDMTATTTATKEKGSATKAGRIPGATYVGGSKETKTSTKPPKARTPKEPKAEAEVKENKPEPKEAPVKADAKGKPKAEKKDKPLSMLGGAAKLLTGRTKPLNCQEMIALMKERNIWVSPGGLTPERSLSAALDREIAADGHKGKKSRFQKVGKGLYLLAGVAYKPEAA